MLHVIAYDIGTTGVKTGLISVGETVELVADAYQGMICTSWKTEERSRTQTSGGAPCAKRPGA